MFKTLRMFPTLEILALNFEPRDGIKHRNASGHTQGWVMARCKSNISQGLQYKSSTSNGLHLVSDESSTLLSPPFFFDFLVSACSSLRHRV